MTIKKTVKTPAVEENNNAALPNSLSDNSFSSAVFARRNRGIVFDVLIFLTNVLLMHLLVNLFLDVAGQASAGNVFAEVGLTLFLLGMLILPSLGAILKRWHYHQDIRRRGQSDDDNFWVFGCFFIPFVYLAVNMCLTAAIGLKLIDIFPSDSEYNAAAFFLGIGLPYNVVQTVLVFRFFVPPKREPEAAFLRNPVSDALGDACIFLNMIFYQLLLNWAITAYPGFHEGKSLDRFLQMAILAVVIYISGRIFFLVRDAHRPLSWLTILLANSVIILRALLGK